MDDRELAEQLFVFMEELYLRTSVQQALLDRLAFPEDDWRSQAERAEILNGPKVHRLFDELRAGLFGPQPGSPPPKNWQEMVRQTLKEK